MSRLPSPVSLTPKRSPRDSSEDEPRPMSPSQFWLGNSKTQSIWSNPRFKQTRTRLYQSRRQVALLAILLFAAFFWLTPPPSTWGRTQTSSVSTKTSISLARPVLAKARPKHGPDPEMWLKENSDNKWAVGTTALGGFGVPPKPRAALISLVRNQELEGIIQSMTQLEYHWNRKYEYPWVFFNDEPFSDEFKVSKFSNVLQCHTLNYICSAQHRTLQKPSVTTKWFRSTIGLYPIGLTKGAL